MEVLKRVPYVFSVFSGDIEEIKSAQRKGVNASKTYARISELLNNEILPWSNQFMEIINHFSADKKYKNIKDLMVELHGPGWKLEQNIVSVQDFLETLQGIAVHVLLDNMGSQEHENRCVLEVLDNMYDNGMLKSILRVVESKGEDSLYYPDAQSLVFMSLLKQVELDYSLKIYKEGKKPGYETR